MLYRVILICLLIVVSVGCNSIQSEPAILYETITISRQTYIYDKPQLRSTRLDTLKEGEQIAVLLEPKNRWLQIKTTGGKIGWVESRDILKQEYYDEWQKLKIQAQGLPVQMKGETAEEAYLRLRPGRDTTKVYKMQGAKHVEIFSIAHTERLDANAKPAPPKDEKKVKPVEPPKDAKGKKKVRRKSDEKKIDTWFLVRTPEGTVGWIYSGLVTLNVPEELARYAENKIILAWHVLTVSRDSEGKEYPWYLSIEREENSDEDFDRVRVLYWNLNRKRYELLYRIQNIVGIFPVDSTRVDPGGKGLPRFKIRHLDEENPEQILVDEYEINGTITKKINTTIEKNG